MMMMMMMMMVVVVVVVVVMMMMMMISSILIHLTNTRSSRINFMLDFKCLDYYLFVTYLTYFNYEILSSDY